MDREALLQELSIAATLVAEQVATIARQREIVDQSKASGDAQLTERAESQLQALLEEQSRLEGELVRLQGRLMFSR